MKKFHDKDLKKIVAEIKRSRSVLDDAIANIDSSDSQVRLQAIVE